MAAPDERQRPEHPPRREEPERKRGRGGRRDRSARGRRAEQPQRIPARGWRDVGLRTARAFSEDNVSLLAAGVAFYSLLALAPALVTLVSIYGLVADPATIERLMASVEDILPEEAQTLLERQLQEIIQISGTGLTVGLVLGVLISLVSARNGVAALMTSCNVAYGEHEDRSFIRYNLVAIGLTAAGIIYAVIALALVAILPAVIGLLDLGDLSQVAVSVLRWPLVAAIVMLGLAVLYRFGPDRERPQWRWASPGALTATVVWLVGSILFSIYISQFASYQQTYGSLAAPIILLLWLWISALAVIVGAEVNAEAERQTRKDTTTGAPEPMGERGAHAADTVGESP